MTVLRSREIIPKSSPPKTLKSRPIEPSTPVAQEKPTLTTTTASSSASQSRTKSISPPLGSDSEAASASPSRRRSARLASKLSGDLGKVLSGDRRKEMDFDVDEGNGSGKKQKGRVLGSRLKDFEENKGLKGDVEKSDFDVNLGKESVENSEDNQETRVSGSDCVEAKEIVENCGNMGLVDGNVGNEKNLNVQHEDEDGSEIGDAKGKSVEKLNCRVTRSVVRKLGGSCSSKGNEGKVLSGERRKRIDSDVDEGNGSSLGSVSGKSRSWKKRKGRVLGSRLNDVEDKEILTGDGKESEFDVEDELSLNLGKKSVESSGSGIGKEEKESDVNVENEETLNVENEDDDGYEIGVVRDKSVEKLNSRLTRSAAKKLGVSFSSKGKEDGEETELGSAGGKREVDEKVPLDTMVNNSNVDLISRSGSAGHSGRQVKRKQKLEGHDKSAPSDVAVDNGVDYRIAKKMFEGSGVDFNGVKFVGDQYVNRDNEGEGEKKGVDYSGNVGVEILGAVTEESASENGLASGKKRYSIEEKGKGKLVKESWLSIGIGQAELNLEPEDENIFEVTEESASGNGLASGKRRYRREEKGKEKLVKESWLSIGVGQADLNLEPEDENTFEVTEESASENGLASGKRRYSREEKGKEKLVKESGLSICIDQVRLNLEPEDENIVEDASTNDYEVACDLLLGNKMVKQEVAKKKARDATLRRREKRERFHEIARENAARFANFQGEDRVHNHLVPPPENEEAPSEVDQAIEDWPGPFSTAMKIISDRQLKAQQNHISSDGNKPNIMIKWIPKQNQRKTSPTSLVPSLRDMCLNILAEHAQDIASLKYIPDLLRSKLSELLCNSRRMDCHFMNLLASDSPTDIRVKDCSWMTEEQITAILQGCDTSNLSVLQLDLCGRCMPDYILRTTLAQSQNGMPTLVSISLRGACRLTDEGLKALVAAAPRLRSVNLGLCSLITSTGINNLALSLGSLLRELYIDDCQNIDAMLIIPALKKLEHLEVLSLAGIQTVCDDFICQVIPVCGANMKELVLANCWNLTDRAVQAIAESCPGLCVLDIFDLHRLTDLAIFHLANGCQSIQTLKLGRCGFSDEAIAIFLEASGKSLKELSLNNVKKVGPKTAISLAERCSRSLQFLDLSWCRGMTDEALGFIVDNCLSLRLLKLFGCTQITRVFLDGHSNPLVRIIGLSMTPILQHLDVFDHQEGPLRYSAVSPPHT